MIRWIANVMLALLLAPLRAVRFAVRAFVSLRAVARVVGWRESLRICRQGMRLCLSLGPVETRKLYNLILGVGVEFALPLCVFIFLIDTAVDLAQSKPTPSMRSIAAALHAHARRYCEIAEARKRWEVIHG